MIKEDYVSFEVAKLLKEKGFNVPTEMVWYEHVPSYNVAHIREAGSKKLDYFYWDENTERNSFYTNDTNENGMPEYIIGKVYSAPTHQMAMKWLREVYNIMVSPYALSLGYYFEIVDLTTRDITGCKPLYQVGIPSKEYVLSTYEEAVEAGIKYYLENLI